MDAEYLSQLNDAQRRAVEYIDGPSLVIAGAGSGKTRVLTYKIVHLLANGYEPWRIMALTFTNKAAREMKDRIAQIVKPKVAERLWMGTFHSIFLRILRRHSELIGFKPGFSIYDTTDTKSLLKIIIKEMALDDKIYKVSTVASIISNAKNAMMTPAMYQREFYTEDRIAKRPMLYKVYETYVKRCHAANAMDFDDILFYMNLLLRDHPDICRHYQDYFRFILVDEYQDTNFAQHLIISQLSAPDNHFCVVGDDAQSIYSFRGALIDNIIGLKNRYPDLKIFKLEQNYRSTKNIVAAAGSLIAKNTVQLKKDVFSENEEGARIDVIQTFSDIEEAYMVAAHITGTKLSDHDTYDDYAVLYRTNAQSRVLEESLRKRNIPYRLVGGTAFYQRKEVKDAIAYFRLTVNPDDDEALRRIINYPARGIGETTLKKLQAAAAEYAVSVWTVLNDPDAYGLSVNAGTMRKLAAFRDMMADFIRDNETSNAFELGQLIFNRTGLISSLGYDNTPENISRRENLQEVLAGLKDFTDMRIESGNDDVSMIAFLSEVMLATDADEKDDTDEPKVTLMTAHAAKGLEFKHVYIVGVEEELFPSSMSMDSMAAVEEERRLLYVAITRAEKTCVMTYAKSRFRNGQTKITEPSRFLRDINPKYLNHDTSGKHNNLDRDDKIGFINPEQNYRRHTTSRPSSPYTNSFKSAPKSSPLTPPSNFKPIGSVSAGAAVGLHTLDEVPIDTRIEHQKFGIGTVIGHGQIAGDASITVDFGVMGERRLMLKFAKFEIID